MRIVISGTVGVGKSTVSLLLHKKLSSKYKTVLFEEIRNENPFLDFFYHDQVEWSNIIQLDFLLERYQTYFQSIDDEKTKIWIFERCYVDDYVFANLKSLKNNVFSFQQIQYLELNKSLKSKIHKKDIPDYFILLKTSLGEVKNRVHKRGRDFEQQESLNIYWDELYEQYYENKEVRNYIKDSVKKVILIDANKSPNDIVDEIIKKINFDV